MSTLSRVAETGWKAVSIYNVHGDPDGLNSGPRKYSVKLALDYSEFANRLYIDVVCHIETPEQRLRYATSDESRIYVNTKRVSGVADLKSLFNRITQSDTLGILLDFRGGWCGTPTVHIRCQS